MLQTQTEGKVESFLSTLKLNKIEQNIVQKNIREKKINKLFSKFRNYKKLKNIIFL